MHIVSPACCNLMYGMISSARGPTTHRRTPAGVLGGALRGAPRGANAPRVGERLTTGLRALGVCGVLQRHAARAAVSPLLVTNADGRRIKGAAIDGRGVMRPLAAALVPLVVL